MENNEIKKDKIKNLKLYYLKSVVLWIIMLVAVGGSLYFLWLAWKNDNTEDKTYVKYIGIGVPSIVAVISGLYSCISNLKSRNESFRNKQEQKLFEEKWSQKKIDADLKAKSRIEWIQDVRKATAQFIKVCYSIIYIADIENGCHINDKLSDIKEKELLLKFYFGFEKNEENKLIICYIDDIISIIKAKTQDTDEIYRNQSLYQKVRTMNEESKIKTIMDNQLTPEQFGKLLISDKMYDYFLKNYYGLFEELIGKIEGLTIAIHNYLEKKWEEAENNKD